MWCQIRQYYVRFDGAIGYGFHGRTSKVYSRQDLQVWLIQKWLGSLIIGYHHNYGQTIYMGAALWVKFCMSGGVIYQEMIIVIKFGTNLLIIKAEINCSVTL